MSRCAAPDLTRPPRPTAHCSTHPHTHHRPHAQWNDAAEGRLAPVRVLNRTSRARLITMQPPWGRLDRDAEGGIGSAHKVACTMYHVLALECFAARCHPCVAHARFAAVFEDDAVFVPGTSPGTAAGFPALAASAAAAAFDAHGVNKLHLAVQKVKAEGRNGAAT